LQKKQTIKTESPKEVFIYFFSPIRLNENSPVLRPFSLGRRICCLDKNTPGLSCL